MSRSQHWLELCALGEVSIRTQTTADDGGSDGQPLMMAHVDKPRSRRATSVGTSTSHQNKRLSSINTQPESEDSAIASILVGKHVLFRPVCCWNPCRCGK
uniref:(northern house mosquito) hypothetical protein n=1 Tax=Culex pipiens TaxID=7175 RepID=A0A8D8CMV3_CULPI